ncbi:MAG: EamA family transporter [Phycisphaerales bacterium]
MRAILFAVLAGLSWGMGELFTKSVLKTGQVGPMGVLLVRALVTVPLAIAAFVIATRVMHAETQADFWKTAESLTLRKLALGSAVFAGFLGVFFFYLALAQPGGDISRVKPIAFTLAPATAVLLGWLVLGESVSRVQWFGVAMVLGGVVLVTVGHKSGAGAATTQSSSGQSVRSLDPSARVDP